MESDHDSNLTLFNVPGGAWLASAGLILIFGAVLVFFVDCYMLFLPRHGNYDDIRYYIPEIMMAVIGAFGAILGVRLLKSVGVGRTQPSRVINEEEWKTIKEQVQGGQEDPITQYIRLTSLTGFSGNFTKLGLTALPLATIGLTIFFSALAFADRAFLDLAKLVLGAFIGSFVQKQIGSTQSQMKSSPPVA